MAITVKHSKVSTIPDDADTNLVRPSDWNADHTLTGLGTIAEQNANAVAITGGTATLTSLTTPTVQATNSGGLSLKNSAGTTQISMGGGGGDNVSVNVSTNLNGTNAQIDISPTGTGHVHMKPTGSGSIEIAPTNVGTINNMSIGATTPSTGAFTTLSATTPVAVSSGGTGLTTLTAGYIPYGNGTSALNSSVNFSYNGSLLNLFQGYTNIRLDTNSDVSNIINLTNNGSGFNVGTRINFQQYGSSLGYINNQYIFPGAWCTDVYGYDNVRFMTGASPTEKARIFSSGGVSIGNTTDAGAGNLSVNGLALIGTTSAIASGTSIVNLGDARQVLTVKGNTSGSYTLGVWNASTTGDALFSYFATEDSLTVRGSISYNRTGGLTVYGTTSDYRSKDIISTTVNSGEMIDSVPVYMGKIKGATLTRPMFIAHETPEYAHTGEKDAVDKDGNPVYQQMDASSLVPVLWAEVQSLRKRLAVLESKQGK